MKIEILGDGCSKCARLKQSVEKAVTDLGLQADIEAVMDPERIAGYQARSLPTLVIDGVPQPAAKIGASLDEVKALLQRKSS
jgi:hypothetical protein